MKFTELEEEVIQEHAEIISFLSWQCYKRFSYAMRRRYDVQDLIQEANIVLLDCIDADRFNNRRRNKVKFRTFVQAAIRNHFNWKILRHNMYKMRDARCNVVSFDSAKMSQQFTTAPNQLRCELRIDLENSRNRVSRRTGLLVDYICTLANGTSRGARSARGELTLRAVEKKLRLSRYDAKKAVKELKQALER